MDAPFPSVPPVTLICVYYQKYLLQHSQKAQMSTAAGGAVCAKPASAAGQRKCLAETWFGPCTRKPLCFQTRPVPWGYSGASDLALAPGQRWPCCHLGMASSLEASCHHWLLALLPWPGAAGGAPASWGLHPSCVTPPALAVLGADGWVFLCRVPLTCSRPVPRLVEDSGVFHARESSVSAKLSCNAAHE